VRFDLLIHGGTVVDPETPSVEQADVAIRDGRIAAVDVAIRTDAAARAIDATGRIVTPGLIDLHAHVYRGVTFWGIDADALGPLTGVTTFVDAGSAGALSLPGLREFVADPARVRIYALLNISSIGLVSRDHELANLAYCDRQNFDLMASLNRDFVKGVKVRMSTPTVGPHGLEPLRIALAAAEDNDLPLMVHIGPPPPTSIDVLPLMRPGDILTHCFTGLGSRITGDGGARIHEVARRAWESGVVMDIGHGAGSFSFETAEALIEDGLWPDVISTDVHQLSINGPMYDLPTCLSKFMALGMPLADAVRAATVRPAQALGLTELGHLRPGGVADVAVFELLDGEVPFYDIAGGRRVGRQLLRNVETIVAGRVLERRPLPPGAPWTEPGHVWPPQEARLRDSQLAFVEAGEDPASLARGAPA
jgi:dihydroorotase